jgi:MATE family multidrug resistance protein
VIAVARSFRSDSAHPITGFAAFLWDVFSSEQPPRSDAQRHDLAAIVFFACYYLTTPLLGNNGLWLAFILTSQYEDHPDVWARKSLRLGEIGSPNSQRELS